jgi:hypothetical protein
MGELTIKRGTNYKYDLFMGRVKAINAAMGVTLSIADIVGYQNDFAKLQFGDNTSYVSDTSLAVFSGLDD